MFEPAKKVAVAGIRQKGKKAREGEGKKKKKKRLNINQE